MVYLSVSSSKLKSSPGAGSVFELSFVSRLKLKKVEETTRPFTYGQNQIPYDYTLEIRNKLKGLDLIECLMNCGQRFVTLYRRQ